MNDDYSPQCFVIIGLKPAEEQFPAEDQCRNYSPSPPFSGDCSIELLMQLHSGSLSNTHFSAQRLFFAFSPSYSCIANRLSPFLSEDIHQRNVSPPSLVTPASLCQLPENQNRLLRLLPDGGRLWTQQHILQHDAFT